MFSREKIDPSEFELKDTVVSISRVTKVVKGGKNLSFSALVVIGDGHGVVGFGIGKAKEVPSAIKKGIESAKKALVRVPLAGTTLPHATLGRFGAGSVQLQALDRHVRVLLADLQIPEAGGRQLLGLKGDRLRPDRPLRRRLAENG